MHKQVLWLDKISSPGAPVPAALLQPPTFMERMSVSGPARFLRQGVSIPTVGGYIAGEKLQRFRY